MKSIVHLPDDLFSLLVQEQGLSLDSVEKRNFSDVHGVTFLSIRLPNLAQQTSPIVTSYKNWPESSRTFENHSILDFERKDRKKEILFPFLMYASKERTTLCSLHVSELPNLRADFRPSFLAYVNAGKRTKSTFMRPHIEYREYTIPRSLRGLVSSFYSIYKVLLYSDGYYQDIIDTDTEEVFSENKKTKKENILISTLPS